MEFLVEMTTSVPDRTPAEDVDDIRAREAAHSRDLAAQHQLLRLWRPPLEPGEWRSFGLFAANDGDQLEEVLAGMPLRVWRSDKVMALAPHPNDPHQHPERPEPPASEGAEFFTWFTLAVPEGTAEQTVDDATAAEAVRTAELAGQGHLERLWALPTPGQALGLWRAPDEAEMHAIIESLPLIDWLTVTTTPLTPHPSDPAITSRANEV